MRPSQRGAQVVSKYKQCAKKIPKVPPPAVNASSFVNDCKVAEDTKEAKPLEPTEEPTVLQDNVGPLSLQNIDRNRDSACHEAFFEERNTWDEPQPAESKCG